MGESATSMGVVRNPIECTPGDYSTYLFSDYWVSCWPRALIEETFGDLADHLSPSDLAELFTRNP